MTREELEKRMLLEGLRVSIAGLIWESDFARVLGRSVKTIERMRLDGKAPKSISVGNRRAYRIEEVVSFLNGETTDDDKVGQNRTIPDKAASPRASVGGNLGRHKQRP